jgi:hypothetical protein
MEQQAGQAPEQTVLMLFRKDLRLDDNPALLAALQAAKHVVSAAATAVRQATCHAQQTQQHHAAATSCLPLHFCSATFHLDIQMLRYTAVFQVPVFIWSPEEEGQFQPGRCSRWVETCASSSRTPAQSADAATQPGRLGATVYNFNASFGCPLMCMLCRHQSLQHSHCFRSPGL